MQQAKKFSKAFKSSNKYPFNEALLNLVKGLPNGIICLQLCNTVKPE